MWVKTRKTLHKSVNEAKKGPMYLVHPFLYQEKSSLAIARATRLKIQASSGTEPRTFAGSMTVQLFKMRQKFISKTQSPASGRVHT